MSFSHSPKIVTDGLVLALDAGNVKSYVSGSTTWFDKSGFSNNGTLVNGVGYTSSFNGSLVFDGTNDYVDTAYTPPAIFSVSVWFKNDTTYDVFNRGILSTYKTNDFRGFYLSTSGPSNPYTVSPAGLNLWYNGNGRVGIPGLNTGQWYNICITSNGSQVLAYLNTVVVASVGNATTHQDVLTIGRSRFDTNYWLGNIAMTQVYSKVLTAAEITQNFNALRSRFGI
jgi:hypothetical protein